MPSRPPGSLVHLLALACLLLGGARSAAGLPTDPSGGPDAARIAPLASEPEEQWSSRVLVFESEPVALGDAFLVSGRDPTGRRALAVLEADSGRVLSRTLLAATRPLALSASGERVAVRTTPNRVDLFRLRVGRLLLERSFVTQSSVSAPRLEDEELLLREDDALVRYDLRRREPAWRLPLAALATLGPIPGAAEGTWHGTPDARGNDLFAGWYDASGAAHLAWIERESGAPRAELVLGRHAQGPGADRDALEVVAQAELVFVHLPPGLPSTSGRILEWARVPFDGERLGRATLHDFLATPAETETGWVAPERARDGAASWILARREELAAPGERERAVELASPEHHAWLAASHVPPSRAGDVLYLGPCAVDARSLAVLWRRATNPAFRPVPIPGGLLVVEEGTLRCLGSTPARPDPARDRARQTALARERALGERLAQLASRALRGGDPERAERLVVEAEGLGASGRTLELVRAEVARERPATLARGPERLAALQAEEDQARAKLLDELADAAERAPLVADRRALLEELFRRAPDHPLGLATLRRELPRGARPEPGSAPSWMEWLAVTTRVPIELVEAPTEGFAPSLEQGWLASERDGWRPDAIGYRSPRLFLITADAAPAAVAHTLQAGELVCDLLEELFGASPGAAERMELVLYPTRDEYLTHSGTDLGGLETVLGFTAGHFDLASRVSRLFLPDPGPAADSSDARLRGVSVHELTHHWLATRSSLGAPRASTATGGFWAVEAIATWAEELRLDPARHAWRTDPRRSASLDTLRNAEPKDLLPWSDLFRASFEDYTKLETRPTVELSLDWQLGAHAPRSPMQLFYAQGAAVLHYLREAENGVHRPLFRAQVEAFYRGAPLDLPARLGLTPEELGARVRAWARSL